MEKGEYNRNTEWMNEMKSEFEKLEEGSKVNLHLDLLRVTLKK